MNRFRTKKKAKDDLFAGRSSEESEQPSLSFRGFRKGKKVQQEEVKLEIDLSTALPSNDDFRTSLLMSNLSARFSMLREQDDPNTKIGKASDDSVLYPKRQSRMTDFGFVGGAGLSDIAEVESIKGGGFLRNSSASNDAGSEKGTSVMDRSRPTDGNNLFGGRQKIYKIPAGAEGGMTGRALYDDDVALSSFQRWKQAERERTLGALNDAGSTSTGDETEPTRPKSPPSASYNRKRETSSTTSSASITARNSTAATSVASQPAAVAKDALSASGAPTPAVATPAVERSVTRTRRLYEQGLTQDMHEQQATSLSRIESLNRQRPFGTRTPDLSLNSTSQLGGSADGSASSRSVLAKASALNLKSTSPSAAARAIGPPSLGINLQTDKGSVGGLPPLSPSGSETGEQPISSSLLKDVEPPAAAVVYQKPPQSYNESQYVQRQLQLQQGRETPNQGHRTETNAASASRSQTHEAKPATIGPRPPAPNARLPPTPVADTESPTSTVGNLPGLSVLPEVNIERPSDKDHPAFRQSAMPTPLSFNGKVSRDPSPSLRPRISIENTHQTSSEDSPTLGPVAGLSGLVRQHLRSESEDSSISGAGMDVSSPASRFHLDSTGPSATGATGSKPSPWSSSGQDWTLSYYGGSSESTSGLPAEQPQHKGDFSLSPSVSARNSNATEDGTDGFASQLADARRRVREKLTSYVESDSSRAASPQLPLESPNLSNPLGIGILKHKTSRGSVVDRSRNMAAGQSKGFKMLGIGAGPANTPPQSGKQSFDEKEIPTEPNSTPDGTPDGDDESNTHPGLRAFKQARRELQKRKELETLARHQMSQTSQSPDQPPDQPSGVPPAPPRADRGARQRTPSRERRPPVSYKQCPPSDEHSYNSPVSTRPSGERDRSGSETSSGPSNSRPPRTRTNTNTNTGQHQGQQHPGHEQPGLPNYRQPMMRSPGLAGADIKGSPIMAPYPYAGRGAPSPAQSPHLDRSRSATNLGLHTGRLGVDPHYGQPSPISPMGLPSPSPFAMGPAGSPIGTHASLGPRPRGPSAAGSPALGPANGVMAGHMKRPIDRRDIGDATFMSSTSRVPTTALPHLPTHQPPHPPYPPHSQYPQHAPYPPQPHQPPPMIPGMGDGGRPYGGSRSRSNSRAAPPVPPINPRRRRDDSCTRPSYDDGGMSAPRMPFTNQGNNNSATNLDHEENRGTLLGDEDESGNRPDQRRRLRKPPPDMQGRGPAPFPGRGRDNSPPYGAQSPPTGRPVASNGMGPNPGMGPGGMI
ncbi:hypothetical protein BT67DRAFT_382451 [Trichocladium antarcticum]|uniref:Uncharacterized protein n=1 Tax=Trichocladium antarcticum TaxID=1450529 RepID=A0AAN6ZDE6_9PEZI|nr:hypothetical protein BT67DRAFT_382451 [Trichocladium antarcticum]